MTSEDIYRALGDVDDALLAEFEKTQRRQTPWKQFGALAACAALLAGGLLWWRPWQTAARPTDEPTTQTAPSATEAVRAGATPLELLPALIFTEGGHDLAADIAYPDGYFIRSLTDAQCAAIWGQEALSWEGFVPSEEHCNVTGNVIYDGQGMPWVVTLSVTADADTLTVELSPERLPPQCIAVEGGEACDFYGTAVTAQTLGSEARVSFLRGEGKTAVGVRMTFPAESEAMTELATRIVSQSLRQDATLSLLSLCTDEIPAWRSEKLTEAQTYADASFGAYFPTELPEGYAFSFAWRELGEDRDWLCAEWTDGRDGMLSLTVSRPEEVSALVHSDQRQAYVWDYYGAVKPDVPEEYFETWSEPIFYRDELTAEVLAARIHPTDEAAKSTARFGIYYPDGTVVRVYAAAERAALETLLAVLLPRA